MDRYKLNPVTDAWLKTDEAYKPYLNELNDVADRNFIFETVDHLPTDFKKAILRNGFALKSKRERNTYIRQTSDKLASYLPEAIRVNITLDEDGIAELAERQAKRCERIANRQRNLVPKTSETVTPICEINSEITSEQERNISLLNCVNGQWRNDAHLIADQKALTEMSELCRKFNIEPPTLENGFNSIDGAINRLKTKNWWRRKLRKVIRQAYEAGARELNLVNSHRQIYASDYTVNNRRAQKLKNENMLSCLYVVNEAEQRYSLKELSDLNISNPAVRKAELMVRMRGFDEYSLEHGHKGLFMTLTCPSKYHSAFAKSGQRNPKFEGYTPYQGNQYLNQVWQRIRSALDKLGVQIYGFRVAEPQHDGTPHWHLLLFTLPKHIKQLKEVTKHYALQEDGDEKGAKENRCDFKDIDPEKGSATGYIAKYVSKNIDGEDLDSGVYGEDPKTASQRVEAWASCWCIRQFQQFGGPSVTVWREARRLRNNTFKDELLENIREAADTSNWQGFISAMGGIFSKRKDHPIKPAYEHKTDTVTGEIKTSYFDGEIMRTLKGLRYKGQLIVTRFFNWRLERSLDRSNLEYCK